MATTEPSDEPGARRGLAGPVQVAAGRIIRRQREMLKLTRAQVIALLDLEIHSQTLATYELGIRSMSLERFVEICLTLRLDPAEVIAQARVDMVTKKPVTVNLIRLSEARTKKLGPLKGWAAMVSSGYNTSEYVVEPVELRGWALRLGMSPDELQDLLEKVA